jgi:pimeloyl-ACP methyl ester carboxylesterase
MATSLTLIGIGYGADLDKREQFLEDTENFARRIDTLPMPEAIRPYAVNPTRVQFQAKDPRGWRDFAEQFAGHSAMGKALTLRGVLARRPPIPNLERELRSLQLPTLVITGDEDDACLTPGIFLKRTIPNAVLWVVPGTGHTVNLEEPDLFNRQLSDFFSTIDLGRWLPRDPRSRGKSTLGNNA